MRDCTYIRVISHLLDDRLIEVTRVALEVISNAVLVLDALEDIGCYGELGALSELCSDVLTFEVNFLHPVLVAGSSNIVNVLLEYHNVVIGDFDSVYRREDGSCFLGRVSMRFAIDKRNKGSRRVRLAGQSMYGDEGDELAGGIHTAVYCRAGEGWHCCHQQRCS